METYSEEEKANLLQIFNTFDTQRTGFIDFSDMQKVADNLGLQGNFADTYPSQVPGKLNFQQFLGILAQVQANLQQQEQDHYQQDQEDLQTTAPNPDMRVLQFLKQYLHSLLQQYRVQCESEGNYVQARKAGQKYEELRKKQTVRQLNQMRVEQEKRLQSIQEAQQAQIEEFSSSWDNYLAEYQATAFQSLQKLKEKHLQQYQEFRLKAYQEAKKKVKPSKELIELKNKEVVLVKQRYYDAAHQVRQQSEELEGREKELQAQKIQKLIGKAQAKIRKQQELQLAALLKRIQRDRLEQLKHREIDSEKLAMRNKNVRNAVISKQNEEAKKTLEQLKRSLKAEKIKKQMG